MVKIVIGAATTNFTPNIPHFYLFYNYCIIHWYQLKHVKVITKKILQLIVFTQRLCFILVGRWFWPMSVQISHDVMAGRAIAGI
ncbi:hypothetical protein E2C01_066304 [Portunus trituberculatus]|uniref:Uncharacterized protein n=1 Tax=Portunus trituberculatus TaxID=210409 RepID=A0A5B7HL63_PORTR|nr:hypothetical protein [Portunus trituberculatus]